MGDRQLTGAQSVNQSIRQSVSCRAFCVCIAIVQMKVAQIVQT